MAVLAATAQPTVVSLFGIQVALDQVIPLTDGYYLIGHTGWTDSRVSDASPAGWNLKAYDAGRLEGPLEPADWNEAGLPATV